MAENMILSKLEGVKARFEEVGQLITDAVSGMMTRERTTRAAPSSSRSGSGMAYS